MPDPAVMKGVLRHFCRTERRRVYDLLGDSELLVRFLSERDEGAFEQIVSRHGPMVPRICRRMLGPAADADDAFQATFLILIRKARSIRRTGLLANWLCAVAYRTAKQALRRRIRIGLRERIVEEFPEPSWTDEAPRDWVPLFDAALQRLPRKYRDPVVLCELQGMPRPAAALRLGLNEGTLSSRLGRARDLCKKLSSAGFPLAMGATLAPLTVPESLLASTVAASVNIGAASVSAVVLTEGVVTAMFASKLKAGAACAAVLFVGAFAGVQLTGPTSQAGPPEKETPGLKEPSSSVLKTPKIGDGKSDTEPPARLPSEYDAFQGEWVAVHAENSGVIGVDSNGIDERWKFTGNMLMTGGEIKEDSTEKFSLNTRAKPPSIDFTLTRFADNGSGQLVPTTFQGIYKFEKDGTLIICYRQLLTGGTILRPTKFLTARNSGATLLTLQRPEQLTAKKVDDLPPPARFDSPVGPVPTPPAPPLLIPAPTNVGSAPVPQSPAVPETTPKSGALNLPGVDAFAPPPPTINDRASTPAAGPTVASAPTASTSDLDQLQGAWSIVKTDNRSASEGNGRDSMVEFLKDRILTSDGTHGRVTIDETKSPKQIVMTMAKPDGEEIRGICKLEGDTFTISTFNKSARLVPTTFEPDNELGISVIVFQRMKDPREPKSVPRAGTRLEPQRIEKSADLPMARNLEKELDQLREHIKRLEKELRERKEAAPPK